MDPLFCVSLRHVLTLDLPNFPAFSCHETEKAISYQEVNNVMSDPGYLCIQKGGEWDSPRVRLKVKKEFSVQTHSERYY